MKNKKTTLDKKHKDNLDSFDKQNDNEHINLIQKKINCYNERLNELNKIKFSDFTNEIIQEKSSLLDKKDKLNKELNKINNNIDEILYYNNTIDYISNYYQEDKKNINTKHVDIVDFFNNSKVIIKDNNLSKGQILDNYLKITENKQIKVSKNKKFNPKICPNKFCDDYEMILHLSEGYLICTNCGFCQTILLDSDKPNYKDPIPDASTYAYRRQNHFQEWLAQFQAKESTDIPEDVYEKILLEMKKQRLLEKNITPKRMRDILKKLELNKYYEHAQHIINRVSGIPPPRITREVEEKFRQMFKQTQKPFTLFCPKDRKNFLSYSYTLHKFCQLLELDDFLPCFPLLKSRDKLKEQDRIWKQICNYLEWEFIPSL